MNIFRTASEHESPVAVPSRIEVSMGAGTVLTVKNPAVFVDRVVRLAEHWERRYALKRDEKYNVSQCSVMSWDWRHSRNLCKNVQRSWKPTANATTHSTNS